ncbi:MAG: hypothetical protein ABIO43_03360 [Sphingomicrobium sp.]
MNKFILTALGVATPLLQTEGANAQIVLSQLVVELQPGKVSRMDIEVLNKDSERAYVVVEPRQINEPGIPGEQSVRNPDPAKLGLLVSPARMVLEPGQHKLLRFADIGATADKERVYRVTVKPVVGGIEGEQSGLKILVGFDVLVLIRPARPVTAVSAVRSGNKLVWRNSGNVSVELTDGRLCQAGEAGTCLKLSGKRLYAGSSWAVELPGNGYVEYLLRSPTGATKRRF